MKFRMTVDNRTHEVEVSQQSLQGNSSPAKVNIDGKIISVAIVERDENSGAMRVKVNDKEYRVALEPKSIPNGGSVNVKLNEAPFQVKVETLAGVAAQPVDARPPRAVAGPMVGEPASKVAAKTSIAGGKSIKPPMPGRIISVRVKEGDNIKSGDVVLILEAMKMANEIVSPFSGKVREVRVSPGQSVAPEDTVISIE